MGIFQVGDTVSRHVDISSTQNIFLAFVKCKLVVSNSRILKPLKPNQKTRTPIEHVVVIWTENMSFDGLYGTYPYALNENPLNPKFCAKKDTKRPNNLLSIDPLTGGTYLQTNRNFDATGNLVNPFRLKRSQCFTADSDHDYNAMINDVNNGLMDRFRINNPYVHGQGADLFTNGNDTPISLPGGISQHVVWTYANNSGPAMTYFDGNTTTAMWNYAQGYSMSDNHFQTIYGPSLGNHMSIFSGSSDSLYSENPGEPYILYPTFSSFPTIGDALAAILNTNYNDNFPYQGIDDAMFVNTLFNTYIGNVFSPKYPAIYDNYVANGYSTEAQINASIERAFNITSQIRSIGDLCKEKNLTYGAFVDQFNITDTTNIPSEGVQYINVYNNGILIPCLQYNGPQIMDGSPDSIGTINGYMYPFYGSVAQLYPAFRNYAHTRPASVEEIGHDGPANHLYDHEDFFAAVDAENLPNVTYMMITFAYSGHPSYSSELHQQKAVARIVNKIMSSKYYENTAIFITRDESGGVYDHVFPPLVRSSDTYLDVPGEVAVNGAIAGIPQIPLQPGYGVRKPLNVVSAWAKENFIDSTVTDATSMVRFIEDNWDLGTISPDTYDAIAASLDNCFDFKKKKLTPRMFINEFSGEVVREYQTRGNV